MTPLEDFDNRVASAASDGTPVGYLWVRVHRVGDDHAVNLTFAHRDDDSEWEHLEAEDPEGTDAYPALRSHQVDWFGPVLDLTWLDDAAAETVRSEQRLSEPWAARPPWSPRSTPLSPDARGAGHPHDDRLLSQRPGMPRRTDHHRRPCRPEGSTDLGVCAAHARSLGVGW